MIGFSPPLQQRVRRPRVVVRLDEDFPFSFPRIAHVDLADDGGIDAIEHANDVALSCRLGNLFELRFPGLTDDNGPWCERVRSGAYRSYYSEQYAARLRVAGTDSEDAR